MQSATENGIFYQKLTHKYANNVYYEKDDGKREQKENKKKTIADPA